jgi:hypothetical protein
VGRASPAPAAARAATTAADRLDDAFRQYLAEVNPQPTSIRNVAALVAGAARVRQAAWSMSSPAARPCLR